MDEGRWRLGGKGWLEEVEWKGVVRRSWVEMGGWRGGAKRRGGEEAMGKEVCREKQMNRKK